MNYQQDYLKSSNPLQNYYSNIPIDPKANQIKKYLFLYAGSKVQRTFVSSNQNTLTLKIKLRIKIKSLSYNLEPLAINFKKLSPALASLKMVSIPTSLPNLSKDHFSIMPANNAKRSSHLKSPQRRYQKCLKQSVEI